MEHTFEGTIGRILEAKAIARDMPVTRKQSEKLSLVQQRLIDQESMMETIVFNLPFGESMLEVNVIVLQLAVCFVETSANHRKTEIVSRVENFKARLSIGAFHLR
jgi:hypothetical protein